MALLQRQAQGQRLVQKTDPQLLLTNRLLQMSTLELQQLVAQELAENPALESPEEHGPETCPIHGRGCSGCPYSLPDPAEMRARRERTRLATPESWNPDEPDPLDFAFSSETLQEHLEAQFGIHGGLEDRPVALYLIANIDTEGYLRCDLDEAAAATGAERGAVERVLRLLQTFDPAGVAARSLQECLLIQARTLARELPEEASGGVPPHLETILIRYWRELAASKWSVIARGLKTTLQEVERTAAWLRHHLTPYPASRFRHSWQKSADGDSRPVRPDVVVSCDEAGDLRVELPAEELPELHVNPEYSRLWQAIRDRAHSFSPAEAKHVRDYMTRAQMVLKSLQDRRSILQRVAEMVVEEQARYFETEREEDMASLTRSQLASFLRVHESTVSRAVAEKYLQLPSGRVVPLSYFFDRALSHRRLIANLVASEDPSSPLSDQEISDRLRREGVVIARRTVMKYREEMNILSSRQRARAVK